MSLAACTFEEHGEVLAYWHQQGWRNETVVLFDRHLDLKKISPQGVERIRAAAQQGTLASLNRDVPFRDDGRHPYGLDNFLFGAAALGLISRLIWVYPEVTPLSPAALGRQLWELLSLVPGHGAEVEQTFALSAHSAWACVAGLRVEVTTLRGLRALELPSGSRLDLDLDYFFEGSERPVHSPQEVLEVLHRQGLTARPPTLTYSIASGFMPESFRYLGEAVAGGMGFTLEPLGQRQSHAPRAMERLSRGAPLAAEERARLFAEELEPLGGAGWSVDALLALQSGALSEAEQSYWRARDTGDRASWPAYAIGLHHLQRKDYAQASQWLERAEGERIDTLQVHGLALRTIAACRLQRYEEALALAEQSIALTSLREEPYRVAALCAKQLGRPEIATQAQEALARLARRRGQETP